MYRACLGTKSPQAHKFLANFDAMTGIQKIRNQVKKKIRKWMYIRKSDVTASEGNTPFRADFAN